jgi:putative ABC transport system permease protein
VFIYNLKCSLRNIRNSKLLSFLNLTGFTVGFTICIIISLFIFKEYTVDTGFENHKNIYRLIDAERNSPKMDYDIAAALKQKFPEISQATTVFNLSFNTSQYAKSVNRTEYVLVKEIISTNNSFFRIFTLPVLVGNKESPFADLNSIVITRSTALKLFGKIDVLGEIIQFASSIKLPVSAVIEDIPENSSMNADLFFNSENKMFRFSESCNGGVCFNPVDLYLLTNSETNIKTLQKKVNSEFPENKSKTSAVFFQPLTNIYMNPGIQENTNRSGSKGLIYVFITTALLILFLSVINYVNFTLSKHLNSLKVIGIKITNGADSNHLKKYYLTEIAISVFISILVALYFASGIIPFVEKLLNAKLNFRWLLSWQLISLFSAIILIVIMVSMLAPSYIIKHSDIQMLFGRKGVKPKKRLGQTLLTVFQITVSIVLLICLVFIQKQLIYVKSTDLGFKKELLLKLNLPENFENISALKLQIANLSFVKSASLSLGSPGAIRMSMSVPETKQLVYNCLYVDKQFLETYDIELLEGRNFMDGDLNESCYINEEAFKKLDWDNLENRKFNNGKNGGYNVVGVVKNFNIASLHKEIEPVCLMFTDNQYSTLNIRLLPGSLAKQMKIIEDTWKSVVPDAKFSYIFLEDYFNSLYRNEEQQGTTIALFALIAFLITCLGMFGQILQVTINKTKEIGIRRINGATVTEIMTMLNKEFLILVTLAFFIAGPISLFIMHKWLQGFAFKTELNWWIFFSAGALALGIAFLTVSWQSWWAATRNPVEALRYE